MNHKEKWLENKSRNSAANLIKSIRVDAGLSVRGLAIKLGVSNQLISRWENEKERIPMHRIVSIGNICGHSERDIRWRLGKSSQYIDNTSECKSLVSMMDDEQLRALHTIMLSLVYK